MNTVKINLEYGCFPVWVYDSEGNLVDNDFPEYLMEDEELESAWKLLQSKLAPGWVLQALPNLQNLK